MFSLIERFILTKKTFRGYRHFKATWIQKYLDPESCSKWKRLFDSELERNRGEAILKGNLNQKDVNNLKISDPFVKEILVIWSEVFSRKR